MKLLNSKQAGEYLGLDRRRLPGFVESGDLEAVILPDSGRNYFTVKALDDFVARRAQKRAQSDAATIRQTPPQLAQFTQRQRQAPKNQHRYEVGWHERVRK